MSRLIYRWAAFLVLAFQPLINAQYRPYNCSETPLCSNLRYKYPSDEEIYVAQLTDSNDDTLNFDLTNGQDNQLIMSIFSVNTGVIRVIIEEPDHHRYHLNHSLQDEPIKQALKIIDSTENYVNAADDMGNAFSVTFDPFLITFYSQNRVIQEFDGRRLIMENTKESQAFAFPIKFNEAKRLIGLHEHPNFLSLMDTTQGELDPYRMKNTDNAAYRFNWTQSLYGTVPLIYSISDITSGLFMHNAAEMWIEIDDASKTAYYMVNGGVLDFFVLLGSTLKESVRQYTSLTGTPHMPQLWALGHHQSKWGYKTTDLVKEIINNFDKYDIPVDSVWLDIDYTDGRKWFTWNLTAFPDPIQLFDWVNEHSNRKIVIISDPHMKVDANYSVYAECLENDYFINDSQGQAYVGTCWPGDASWIDFLNPEARDYYAKRHLYSNFPSTSTLAGFWNDMNEPATFDQINELTIPNDVLHYGNVPHGHIHNIYGLTQVLSTHKGLIDRDNGTLRPFLLSRSFFAGSQRYTAKWAGDTDSTFDYLRILVPMTISANLAGAVFYGGDVPGFFGDPAPELATRFYQTAAWIPFFRAHSDQPTASREPWTFPEETRLLIRAAIQTRYKHLPYWYTLFYEHTTSGDPIIRPIFYQYPEDDNTLDLNDEYLVGTDILVANVYFSDATDVRVYVPGNNELWYLITGNSNVIYSGAEWYKVPVDISFIPVFYRSGSVIVQQFNLGPSSTVINDGSYELHVLPDENGEASTSLYIDDFKSFRYQTHNEFLYLNIRFDISTNSISAQMVAGNPLNADFTLIIESVVLYINNGDGTFTKEKHVQTKDGDALASINILENSILL